MHVDLIGAVSNGYRMLHPRLRLIGYGIHGQFAPESTRLAGRAFGSDIGDSSLAQQNEPSFRNQRIGSANTS